MWMAYREKDYRQSLQEEQDSHNGIGPPAEVCPVTYNVDTCCTNTAY